MRRFPAAEGCRQARPGAAPRLDFGPSGTYFPAMAIRPIIETPDPLLRQISAPVEQVTDEIRALVGDMLETMYAAPGIGLAAIQVGVPKRVLVIDLQEPEEEEGEPVRKPRIFINPEIVRASETLQVYNEGCLSVPEMYAEVERPERIRARWLDRDGTAREEELDGLLAICLQHEMDHLEGILFIDHLSRLKRDMILKKLAKARKERSKLAA
jgi:peptide deformylase